jgi:FkbM family methyltransferase
LNVIERLFWHLKNEDNVLRWISSRFLFYTGLGRIFTKNFGLYKVRFFPSAISLQKWVDPLYGIQDERLLRRILRPKDSVIDVGSNIGTISLASASLVGEEGLIMAFEPNPRIFKYLVENIKLNKFRNIIPLNFAVGERLGEVYFSDKKHDDQNTIQTQSGQRVHMTTLDEQSIVIQGRIRLLKVDVEGYEKFVFLGASKTIARTDYIYFEVCDSHFIPLGYKTSDLLKMLNGFGFCSYRFDEQGNEIVLETDFVPEKYTNLLAKRNDI